MDYEGQICRAPSERSAYMLPVSVGCSYNACKFCMLFKHLEYRELPLDQIEAELCRVAALGGAPERIYLGDGNAFGLPTERLLTILALIRRTFPGCREVNMDATVTNIAEKSGAELSALATAGVSCLYLGIESGLDDVLRFMHKEHDNIEAAAQISRLHENGIAYAAHIMAGIAGAGHGLENAEATAEFLNRTRPVRVVNFSMFLHMDSPLGREVKAGRFSPADEVECFREERRLIELLDGPLDYDGIHDFIPLRVRGELPHSRAAMLEKLDSAIAQNAPRPPVCAVVSGKF